MQKKDVWVCHLTQCVVDKTVIIEVAPMRVGTTTSWVTYMRNKKEAIEVAVNTARVLYYNTVLGTNIPLDPRVVATYQFNKNPRIEIKESKRIPMTVRLSSNPSMQPITCHTFPVEVVSIDRSKKEAEALLDKITTRYAKYIEDEDYWQDVFKQQAQETPIETHDK